MPDDWRARRGLLAALAVGMLVAEARAQQLPWGGLPRGQHGVGYRVERAYDRSRTFASADPSSSDTVPIDRLIELRIWYPTAAAAATAMPYRGYRDVIAADGPVGPLTDSLLIRFDAYHGLSSRGMGGERVLARVLEQRTGAVRDAQPAAGPFPLVLYAHGFNDASDENVMLAEHLASRGYVVASVPAQGFRTVTQQRGETLALESIVRDMEWALARLLERPEVNATRVGTIGFSFGGACALVMAMRNHRVGAVVALDPTFVHREYMTNGGPPVFFDRSTFRAALLVAAQRRDGMTFALLDSIPRAPRFTLQIAGLRHGDFNSYGAVYRTAVPSLQQDSTFRFRADAYVGLVTYIADFLDAHLARNADASSAIRSKPRWRGVRADSVHFGFQLGGQ